jgi:hypothetical protein
MTPRQFRIGGIVLSAAFAGLGIWALAEAKYGTGTFWLVMSVAWMLLAFFRNDTLRVQERRRQRLRVTADPGAARPPSALVQPGQPTWLVLESGHQRTCVLV